mgnify:CR=1 FL=1
MARFEAAKLRDFFKYYDERNPKHQAAVLELAQKIQELDASLLSDEANWVRVYRTPWPGASQPVTQAQIRLEVPFFPQIDNYTMPYRTCNSSSCAMLLAYEKPGSIKDDDEYLRTVLSLGDTTVHEVQTKALAKYGLKTEFRTDLDFTDLDRSLAAGHPVVIAIYHRGTLQNPTGGHVIIVVGRDANGDYLCHDPYGSLHDGYQGPVSNGKFVLYTRHILLHRWIAGDGGWGRLVL